MGIRDFMYTEKGKITGSVLAAVLISAAVFVPVSIFADRAVRGTGGSEYESVEVWGYDDQVSSTGEKMNAYMNIDMQEAQNIYGGPGEMTMSGEPTLLQNEHYHSVIDDVDILDGVYGAEGALGYLSSSWVEGYEGQPFKMLSIYDGTLNGPTNEKESYVEADTSSDAYVTAQPGLQATLNANLRLPKEVADWVRPFFSTSGLVALTAPTPEVTEYVDWLNANNLADDFIVSLGFFGYMAYDTSNIESVNSAVMAGTNDAGSFEFDASSLTAMQESYVAIAGDGADLLADVLAQQKETSGFYDIAVDGTGTDTGVFMIELQNFEEDIDALTGESIYFNYKFVNGGSGQGWKAPDTSIPGVNPNPGSDAQKESFIGTQSRFSKDSEVTEWGYEASAATDSNDGVTYVSPEETGAGDMIGYTMGIDLPVFFVEKEFSFDYTVKSLTQVKAINGATNEQVGTTVKIKPTGLSPQGAKMIYQDGASWNAVMDAGLMIAELA